MTGNKVLLDTNIVIDLFKGDQQILTFWMSNKMCLYLLQFWLSCI